MSKPRSRLIGRAENEFGTPHGFTTAISFGKQSKHLPCQPNHDSSKSVVTAGNQDLHRLVGQKAITGRWEGKNIEVVDYGTVIGRHRDPRTGKFADTTRETFHYSRTGARTLPTDPAPKKGRTS